jgi:hypothetical protein
MHKKLAAACMAISALAAFSLAAAASASVVTESGTAVAVGASLRATNTGLVRVTGAIPVECTDFYLAGTLTGNTGNTTKGEVPVGGTRMAGTGEKEDCTSPLGNVIVTINSELCWSIAKASDNVVVTGCGANVTYTLTFTETGFCKYSTAFVEATAKTNVDFTINVFERPAKLEEGGIFCPAEVKLDADLDFNTTDGTTLVLS